MNSAWTQTSSSPWRNLFQSFSGKHRRIPYLKMPSGRRFNGLAETAPLNDWLSQRYRNKPPHIEGELAESSTLRPLSVPLRRGILAQVGAQGNACRKPAESAKP